MKKLFLLAIVIAVCSCKKGLVIDTYSTFDDKKIKTNKEDIITAYTGTLNLKQYTIVNCLNPDLNSPYDYYFVFEGSIKINTKVSKTSSGYHLTYELDYNLSGSPDDYECTETFKDKIDISDPYNYQFAYKVKFTSNSNPDHFIIVNASYVVSQNNSSNSKIFISNFDYDSGGCY